MEKVFDEVTLYHGDCYDIIPTLENKSIDLVITDPPYQLGSCAGGGLYKPIKGDDEDNPYGTEKVWKYLNS